MFATLVNTHLADANQTMKKCKLTNFRKFANSSNRVMFGEIFLGQKHRAIGYGALMWTFHKLHFVHNSKFRQKSAFGIDEFDCHTE